MPFARQEQEVRQSPFEATRWRAIGGCAPLVGVLGQGTALLVVLSLLVGGVSTEGRQAYKQGLWWLSPVLAIAFGWTIAYAMCAVDRSTISWAVDQVQQRPDVGIGLLWESFSQIFLLASRGLSGCLRLVILACIVGRLSRERRPNYWFCEGALYGSLPSLLIIVGQACTFVPELHAHNSFWTALGRPSGLFSDPNAFGVGACLIAAVALTVRSRWAALAAVGWLGVGPLSGSRTFILGAIALVIGHISIRTSKIRQIGVAMILCGIAALGVLLIGGIPVSEYLPLGLSRALNSLSASEGNDSLFSRALFWRINLKVGLDYPLAGVGFQNFPSIVPRYALWLGANTGEWMDNTNSFYLGIWSETGVLGVCAYALVLMRSCLQLRSAAAIVGVGSLLLMLVTGPHVDFVEITLLASFLIANVISISERRPRGWETGALAVCSVLPVLSMAQGGEYGLYGWESADDGLFRWSTGAFQTFVDCNHEQQLQVRALTPGATTVRVYGQVDTEAVSLALHGAQWQKIPVDCTDQHSRKRVTLAVSRVWSPAYQSPGKSEDSRILGVAVRIS